MSEKTKKQEPVIKMILYRCPNCGVLQMISMEKIDNDESWCCERCETTMEISD